MNFYKTIAGFDFFCKFIKTYIMKNKYILLMLAFTVFSCTIDDSVDIKEEESYVPKFPFEKLDQTNFNNASSVLTATPTNVRLDSVVNIRYYKFNPITNLSDYDSNALNAHDKAYAPPPPEPTHRSSDHFHYNENKQLTSIYSYSNYDYTDVDLSVTGELQYIQVFDYDNQNNLITSGYQETNDSGTIINQKEFFYTNLNVLKEVIQNDWTKKIERNNNQLVIEQFSSESEWKYNSIYFLDSFNNLTRYIYQPSTLYEFKDEFFYPKNIFNPFVNLFPENFYSFFVLGESQGGFSHFSAKSAANYYQQIQVNSQGFPEVVQSGSYDDGYRTLYYYSNY